MGEVMMTMSGGGTKREEELLLGIDFGTGGCKISAVTPEGELRGEASIEYPTYHEHPGWSEQDPALWIQAFCNTVRACREQMADGFEGVLGLAVTASTPARVLATARPMSSWQCMEIGTFSTLCISETM